MSKNYYIKDLVTFMPMLAGILQVICLIYCGYFWKPSPMKITDPDISWACWLYCNALGSEENPLKWQILIYSGAVLTIVASVLLKLHRYMVGKPAAFVGGLILLPVGLLSWIPFFSGFTYRKDTEKFI